MEGCRRGSSAGIVPTARQVGDAYPTWLCRSHRVGGRTPCEVHAPGEMGDGMAFRPWEYRTETGSVGYEVDLAGYSVAAVDGDIGHVDEAVNGLLGPSYLLVDTGPVY